MRCRGTGLDHHAHGLEHLAGGQPEDPEASPYLLTGQLAATQAVLGAQMSPVHVDAAPVSD